MKNKSTQTPYLFQSPMNPPARMVAKTYTGAQYSRPLTAAVIDKQNLPALLKDRDADLPISE